MLPLLLVLILAPALAWALFTFVLRSGVLPSPSDLIGGGTSATPTGGGGTGGPGETGATDGPGTATPTASPVLDVRYGTAVTFLDGTDAGTDGQDLATALETAGYQQLRVGQYSAGDPAATTVYYRDATVEDTARDVAARIERATGARAVDVVESATAASSAPIVVVLRD